MQIVNLKRNSQTPFYKFYYRLNNKSVMNIYLFWILFLALWAIVPLMIIKGRTDETPKIKTSPEANSTKKGWFK